MTVCDGLSVCVDCAIFIANGELPDDDAAAAAVVEGVERELPAQWVMACGEDCEGGFAWTPCDCCGSTLGGERHPAALLTP